MSRRPRRSARFRLGVVFVALAAVAGTGRAGLRDGVGGAASAPVPAPSRSPRPHRDHVPHPLRVYGTLHTEKHIIGYLRDPSGSAFADCTFSDADAPKNGPIGLEEINHDPLVSHRFLLNLDDKDVEILCGLSRDACVDADNVYDVRFAFDPHGDAPGGDARTGVRGTLTVLRDGRRDTRSFEGECRASPPPSIP